MNCPNCGSPIREGNKFCTNCGTPLPLIPVDQAAEAVPPVVPFEAPAPEEQPIPFVNEEAAPEAPAEEIPQEPVISEPVSVPEEVPADVPEPAPFVAGEPAPAEEIPAAPFEPAPEPQGQPDPNQAPPFQGGYIPPQDQPFQGAPVQNPNDAGQFNPYLNVPPQQPAAKKKLSKGALIGIIAGGVVLIGLIVALLIFLFPKEPERITIDLNDYTKIEFEGYSYDGSIKTYEIDRERLLQELGESIQYTRAARRELRSTTRAMTAAEFFEQNVLFSLYLTYTSDGWSLKNGDTVSFDWTDYGISQIKWTNVDLQYGPFDVTVEGLTEPAKFDPFEDLEVTFTGESGKGRMEVKEPSDDIYSYLYFTYDGQDTLSNGDTVELKLDELEDWAIGSLVRNFKKLPSVTSKTYTVEGLIEAQLFDPFDYVEVKFSGFGGQGKAEVVVDTEQCPALADIEFYASPRSFLNNGDEVTVDFYWSDFRRDQMVLEYGIEPSITSKTYTVEGLDHYIEKYDELPQEVTDQMVKDIRDFMDEQLGALNEELAKTNENAKLSVETTLKEVRIYTKDSKLLGGNRVYLVLEVTLTGVNGFSKTYLTANRYTDVKTKDGVVTFSEDCNTADYRTPSESFSIQYNDGGGYLHTFTIYGCETEEDQEKALSDNNSGYTFVEHP